MGKLSKKSNCYRKSVIYKYIFIKHKNCNNTQIVTCIYLPMVKNIDIDTALKNSL